MTQENKEAMIRAIGMIEGVSFLVSQEVANALACAVEMLESVYKEKNN